MRKIKALSLVLAGMLLMSMLALVATPVLADGNGGGNDKGNGPWSDDGGEKPANPGQKIKDEMYQKGVDKSLMGKMSYQNGYGQGGFVFYFLDEENGTIEDYGLITSEGEKVLITSITVDGFQPDDIDTHGSLAKMADGETLAVVHDNPTGMYHLFVNESVEIVIVLAGDMVVTQQKQLNESCELSYQLVISDGETTGVIASDDPFEITENGTVVSCQVSDDLMIRFLPQVAHRNQWTEMVLMQAVQSGKMAAEITLMADDSGGIYDAASYRNELQVQVQNVVKNQFQLTAEGQNGNGALIMLHTEIKTMDMTQDRLRVRLNDQEMKQVDDPLELVYGEPDEACYAVIDDGEVQQMLVYLPASALGSITVEGFDPLADLLSPVGLAMVIGALALVGIAGAVVLRKR